MLHECSQLLILCLCSDSVGWSDTNKFRTPPATGSDETFFVIYGDMGKAPLDPSVEHYIQVYPKMLPSCKNCLVPDPPYAGCIFPYEMH
jgi:hypothetical protein